MKTDIWMPLYINDYLGDTMDLDAEGHGIYILLLMVLWKKGNLPSDKRRLMRIARTQDSELLDEILEDYFYLTEEGYSQKRAEEEKAKADKNREIARENGRKGGRPKTQKNPTGYEEDNPEETHGLTHGEPNAEAKPNPEKSSSPSPSPIPLPSTKTTPKDVLGVIWKYWNEKENLPTDPYMPTSMSDPRRMLTIAMGHGVDRVKECIDKLDRIYPSLDKKPATPGSLLSNNSVTYWLNAKEESGKAETMSQEEMDQFAQEVFG